MSVNKVVAFVLMSMLGLGILVIGCGKKESDVIIFGSVLSLTGDAASYGTMMKNGMDIAVDEINAAGGIDGKRIAVKYEDSQFDPRTAVTVAQKLIELDKVQVITGITGSKNALAVVPIANNSKVVVIDPLSSAAKLTSEGGKFYFRVMPSDDFAGAFAAEWAAGENWKNGAIFYANDDWGTAIRDAARQKYESLGGTISAVEAVTPGTRDFRTSIGKLRGMKLDVVFLFAYAPEGGIIVKQTRESKIGARFLGSDNLSAGEFTQVGPDAIEGAMFVLPAEGSGEVYESFQKEYKKRHGEAASINSIKSYDVVRLAAFAVSKVGYDGEKIREFLSNQLSNYDGASGMIEFDQNGDIKNPAYEKMMYRAGKYVKLEAR